MKKLFIVLACFISVHTLAQDTTKKKGTVDITSAFKPVLKESAKINFNASPAPVDTTKPAVLPSPNPKPAWTKGVFKLPKPALI